MDLLKAIEEYGEGTVGEPTPPPVVTPIAQAPAIAPDIENPKPAVELTDDDKTQILLFMLKKALGMDRFCEVISAYATDMEVYGLISSAEKAKINCQCMAKHCSEERFTRPLVMAAIKMAVSKGTDSAKEYLAAEEAEHQAIAKILEEFSADSKKAIVSMLNDDIRRSMSMNGPHAKTIQSVLVELREHF